MADENDGGQVNCRIGGFIILFAALACNIAELVLCVVKKSFRAPGKILIHSLAVVDTILAAVLLARVILATSAEKTSNVNAVARIGSLVLLLSTCLVQLAHVLAIGGERFLAVRYPLRFQQTHTKSNIRKFLFIIWLIPCMLGAAIATLCGWSGNERGIYYALSAAYSVTAVFLSVLYYQLIKRRRNNHLNVNPCRRNKNKAEDSENHINEGNTNNDFGNNASSSNNNSNSKCEDNSEKGSQMHQRGDNSNNNHEIFTIVESGNNNSRNKNNNELSKNTNDANSSNNNDFSGNENSSNAINNNNSELSNHNNNNTDNIKSNNNNGTTSGNSVPGNKAARDSRDKLLLILSIGITGTFFLLNTPIIVYGLLFDVQSLTCGSPEGLFVALATSCASVNLVTDPLLYFFITNRIRRRQASIRRKTQQRNVKPNQVHSLCSIQQSGLFENGSDIQRLK